MTIAELVELSQKPCAIVPKTIIFLGREFKKDATYRVPIIFQTFWDRFNALPQNIIFLHVQIEKKPHMHHQRFEIVTFKKGKDSLGSIVAVNISFGYWERPNVEEILDDLAQHHLIDIKDDHRQWLLYIIQERVYAAKQEMSFFKSLRIKVFKVLLKNVDHKDSYFGLGQDIGLSAESIPVYID